MDLHWNDSETAESIKETKVICAHAIQEAKAAYSTAIKEAETVCSAAIREVETWGASQAESLHRWHAKVIKHLEEQVIQEEGKSQIDFLSACQAALNANPGEFRGTLVASYHLLMGRPPCLTHSPYHKELLLLSNHCFSSSSCTSTWTLPQPKRWLPSPDPVDSTPLGRTMSKATAEGPLAPKVRGPTLLQDAQAEPLRSIQPGH